MNRNYITITPIELINLVKTTYDFLLTQDKLTDDDIKLVALTLTDIIEKNKVLKT